MGCPPKRGHRSGNAAPVVEATAAVALAANGALAVAAGDEPAVLGDITEHAVVEGNGRAVAVLATAL